MITLLQQPERITPSNLEMVYNLSSNNINQPNFKYVVDVYYKPYENGYYPEVFEGEKLARLKIRANKQGNCIVDIQEIVSNKLTPNIRKDYEEPIGQQYFSMFTGGNNGYDSYFVTKPTIFLGFSQINGNNHIPDFEVKDHFNEFRVIVGEEYDVNGVKTIFIDDRPSLPVSEMTVTGVSGFAPFSAVSTSIQYEDAGLYYGGVTSLDGVDWKWTNSNQGTVYESGTSTPYDAVITTTTEPLNNDKFVVTERYSGKQVIFSWDDSTTGTPGMVEGWVYEKVVWPSPTGTYSAAKLGRSFYSWVATVRREDRLQRQDLIGTVYQNQSNQNGKANHLFNWSPYVIPKDGPLGLEPGRQQADIGWLSPMPYKVSTTDTFPYFYDFYTKNFEKNWYYGQPVMFSFLNSYCHEFANEVRAIARKVVYKNGLETDTLIYNTKLNGGGPLTNPQSTYPPFLGQEVENRLTHFTDNQVNTESTGQHPTEIKEIFYWLITDGNSLPNPVGPGNVGNWEVQGNVPYFHLKAKNTSCFENEPINFVYLNPMGGWDTFTFGMKNTKTYSKKTKSYSKGKFIQGTNYNRLSQEEKTLIYDQETSVSVTAQSDYVDEYESKYIEDLVLSPYVYIVTNTEGIGGNGIESNPELIPIVIKDKKVVEYKKNYQKLKQYTVSFEYDNIKGHRVQL